MVITLLIWCFVFIVSCGYGQTILQLLKFNPENEHPPYYPSHLVPIFFIGFIFCNVLASIINLFVPIRILAFFIITLPGFLFFLKWIRSRNSNYIFKPITSGISQFLYITTGLCLLLFTLWLTSGAIKNADTYIYHAQSIHWIESYPVIIGLGNFFNRLAYNSGWFVQNALFSFSFLGGRSFHVLNGLLLFIISMFFIMEFILAFKKHEIGLPQIWGLTIIPLGIISIGTQASAPSTDMPVAYLSWMAAYLCMRFIKQENSFLSIFIISGIITFAFTIKISIAPLFFIPAFLILMKIKAIKFKNMLSVFIWVGLIILPWMIRNVIISGYAVYPSASTALPVEWRIPTSLVKEDAMGIQAFGFYERATQEEVMDKPFFERIKFWYYNLTLNQKMMVLVSLFTPIILGIISFISFLNHKFLLSKYEMITITGFFGGFLFWVFVSPNLRFGYVYILFLFSICVSAAIFWIISVFNLTQKTIGSIGFFGLTILMIVLFARSFNFNDFKNRYLFPLDYDHRSTQPCLIDEGQVTIFCASEYGECGYHSFPCHAWGNENVRMYGDKLQDGFYLDYPNVD
jgi:hypothetical protein